MKVLFVNPASGVYGSERSMLALLRTRQFDAEVVCPGTGSLEQALRHLEIKVHPLEFGKYSVRQNIFWHVEFYRRFRRILAESHPDVVAINLDGNTPLVTLAAVRAGIPIVRFSRFEFTPPTRWLDRWCWFKAKAIICPSQLVKQQVLAWIPPEFRRRVHHIYDSCADRPAAPQAVAAFQQQFHLADSRVIGYVGRLDRGKRIETAIEALAALRQKIGNARLLIIGGASSAGETGYAEELQQLATELGVREAVTFTGFIPPEDISAAIASLDVCVLPSASESFGMVLMEAWAQGVPTVASDVGGSGEITQASGGGCLATVGDASSFAAHLLTLLTNRETAAAKGRSGMAWVRANCDPVESSSKFAAIVSDLLPALNES